MKKSIRAKILVPTLLVVVLAFISLGGATINIAQGLFREDIEKLANRDVAHMVTYIDGQLGTWSYQLQHLAASSGVVAHDWNRVQSYLTERDDLLSGFEMFFLADRTGLARTTAGETTNIADRAYFPRVMAGEVVISEPVINRATNVAVVVIAAPVRNSRGQITGLFGGTVTLNSFAAMIARQSQGSSYAYLQDANGQILVHPDSAKLFEQSYLGAELGAQVVSGRTGSQLHSLDNKRYLCSYAPLAGTDWFVVRLIDYSEVAGGLTTIRNAAYMVGGFALAALVAVISYILNLLLKPVLTMTRVTQQLAAGDLQVELAVNSEDEVGQLASHFNAMVNNMRALLHEVQEVGSTVAASSQEMMASAQENSKVAEQVALTVSDLAQGAGEQAASATTGSEMVRELVDGLRQVSSNAQGAAQLTERAKAKVEEGSDAVSTQRTKMIETKEAAHRAEAAIGRLEDTSQQVGRIVELIENIASQTNLLALNAAIEAARAGEQGKGFAVVADEVRKLAEQSRAATGQISELIKGMQVGVQDAVREMKSAGEAVDEQDQAAQETAASFQEIRESVTQVLQAAHGAAEATKKLSESANQVGVAIENIASITEENAASSEEIAASTEEQTAAMEEIAASAEALANLSQRLQGAITRFKV